MSNTRRELFKGSVMTTLALMSAGAAAGCTGAGLLTPGPSSSDATVVGYSGGLWYLFVPDGLGYLVYSTPRTLGSPAPSTNPFDTAQYLTAERACTCSGLTAVTSPFSAWGLNFTFTSTGHLDLGSQQFLVDNTQNAAVAGHWNEIGRQ